MDDDSFITIKIDDTRVIEVPRDWYMQVRGGNKRITGLVVKLIENIKKSKNEQSYTKCFKNFIQELIKLKDENAMSEIDDTIVRENLYCFIRDLWAVDLGLNMAEIIEMLEVYLNHVSPPRTMKIKEDIIKEMAEKVREKKFAVEDIYAFMKFLCEFVSENATIQNDVYYEDNRCEDAAISFIIENIKEFTLEFIELYPKFRDGIIKDWDIKFKMDASTLIQALNAGEEITDIDFSDRLEIERNPRSSVDAVITEELDFSAIKEILELVFLELSSYLEDRDEFMKEYTGDIIR